MNNSTDVELDHESNETVSDKPSANLTRRGTLLALGGLGVLGLSSQPAAAATDGDTLTFGGTFAGSPMGNTGLEVDNQNEDGFEFGLVGRSRADQGRALAGFADNDSGNSIALLGRNQSSDGTGIRALCDAESGGTNGIFGQVRSPTGRGIYATNTADDGGPAYGCVAQSNSTSGTGLRGVAIADSGETYGVVGAVDSPDGYGVYSDGDSRTKGDHEVTGELTADEGIKGVTASEEGGSAGVTGHATASDLDTATMGVEGISDADADNSSSPEVLPAGVHGRTTGDGASHGVRGETDSYNGRGMMGFSTSESYEHDTFTTTGAAVMGVTDLSGDDEGLVESIGVVGSSVAQEGTSYGVLGRNESPDGAAVLGNSTHPDGIAVFANGDSYTSGDHTVTGDADVGGLLEATDVQTEEVLAETVAVSTDDDSDEIAAIYGEATDTTSENYGVVGTTASANSDASGVLGIAEATGGSIYPKGVTGVAEDGIAMHALHNATDGFSVGLFALTHSDSGQAIQANASADSGETSGVYGRSGSPDGHGVRGKGEGSSGPSIGVLGQTESPEGYGVYSEADTRSDGLLEAGDGVVHEQRGEPSTDELADGDVMTYNSDGSDGHSAGDLVYAINDGGSILTQVIAEKSNAS